MRRILFCLILFHSFAGPALAAPSIDQPVAELRLTDGRVLKNARLKSFNSTSVFVKDDDGIEQVRYELFPAELQPQLAKARGSTEAEDNPAPSPPAETPADATGSREQQIAAFTTERDKAIRAVQNIVNQPVTHLQRTPDMQVVVYSPGWFHAGAMTPDFNTADVRATQESIYSSFQYVTSDLNPGEAFIGRELEFNSMTKYFYTDRSVPKKKLTGDEMLEINRLYRIIGRCNQKLAELGRQ